MKTKERKIALQTLEKENKVIKLNIDGIKENFYIRTEYLALLQEIMRNKEFIPKCNILAPLDNMMWDRKLIKAIFDFDYKWEVYTPIAERKYGYYVLPVMYGENFIGRFDSKFDKKKKELKILNWWWEDENYSTLQLKKEINEKFNMFSKYLGAEKIVGLEKIK